MYYNIKTEEVLTACPLDGYLPEGALVQGLDLADAETQKLCGILLVKSDTPTQPADTYEDVGQRVVNIEEDGVTVVRTWLPNPVIVPSSISPRQIRLWLVENGVSLATVDAAINNIEDPLLREKTQIEWEFSPYIERSHPMVVTLGAALGLSNEQIDQAFIAAAQI